jgi:hypothetical protein
MKEVIKLIRAHFSGSYRFPIDFCSIVEAMGSIDVIHTGSTQSPISLPIFGLVNVEMHEYYIVDYSTSKDGNYDIPEKRFIRRYTIDGVLIDSQELGE